MEQGGSHQNHFPSEVISSSGTFSLKLAFSMKGAKGPVLILYVPSHQNNSTDAWMWEVRMSPMWLFVERGSTIYNGKETSQSLSKLLFFKAWSLSLSLPLQCNARVSKRCGEEKCSLDRWGCAPYRAILGAKEHSALHIRPFMWPSLAAGRSDICMHNLQGQVSALMRCKELIILA